MSPGLVCIKFCSNLFSQRTFYPRFVYSSVYVSVLCVGLSVAVFTLPERQRYFVYNVHLTYL